MHRLRQVDSRCHGREKGRLQERRGEEQRRLARTDRGMVLRRGAVPRAGHKGDAMSEYDGRRPDMVKLWIDTEYPTVIIADRYNGTYSGGSWLAFPTCSEPEEAQERGDLAEQFFDDPPYPIGRGETPGDAYGHLHQQMASLAWCPQLPPHHPTQEERAASIAYGNRLREIWPQSDIYGELYGQAK